MGLAICLTAMAARAEVYRCQRGDKTVYTDKPCHKDAKPAELPDINFVGTPGAAKSDAQLAKEWDQRLEKDRKARDKADSAWIKEHDAHQEKAERVRAGLNRRKVVKGMTPDQVREVLGEPDAQTLQEGRENITIWSYKPDNGPQYTISFRNGEVNSVSSRSSRKKKKS